MLYDPYFNFLPVKSKVFAAENKAAAATSKEDQESDKVALVCNSGNKFGNQDYYVYTMPDVEEARVLIQKSSVARDEIRTMFKEKGQLVFQVYDREGAAFATMLTIQRV